MIENIFEKIGFWLQRVWGISALRLSILFIKLLSLSIMLRVGLYWFPALLPHALSKRGLAQTVVDMIFILFLQLYACKIQEEEERMFSNGTAAMNSFRINPHHRFCRLALFLLAPLYTPDVARTLWVHWTTEPWPQLVLGTVITGSRLLALFIFYFSACNIHPPGTSKVRAWLNSWGKQLQPAVVRK